MITDERVDDIGQQISQVRTELDQFKDVVASVKTERQDQSARGTLTGPKKSRSEIASDDTFTTSEAVLCRAI